MRGNPKIQAFCYLFNQAPKVETFLREHQDKVSLSLAFPITGHRYMPIKYDERDQRALVIFDGEIPWCGLPKAAEQSMVQLSGELVCSSSHQRKPRECELPGPWRNNGDETLVPIYRRALLLPAGKALILRYRDRSFAGCYSLVTVKRVNEEEVDVEFINTDY